MFRYVIKRIVLLIPVLIGVAFIVFGLLYLTPGDPARMILGEMADEQSVQDFRKANGLDDPFLVQFGRYLYKATTKGDIGISYVTKRPVSQEIQERFPATLKLSFFAVVIAIMLGIPFGVLSSVKQYSIYDSVIMVLALFGVSMPVFWLGLLLILLFSVHLGWLPSSGFDTAQAMILPCIALAANSTAILTRMTRSSMLEVIRQDYIRTVRAKGQTEGKIIFYHALGNALIPIVTIIGLQFGMLLGGALLTETVFAVPGVGRLMVDSIKMRDYPVVQGGVLYIAVAFSVVNLLVDLVYAYIDPRIKAQYR